MKKNKKVPNKASPLHNRNLKSCKHQNSSTQSRDENIKRNSKQITKQPSTSQIKIFKNQQTCKNKKLQDHYTKILNPASNIKNIFINKQNKGYNNVQSKQYRIQQSRFRKQHPTCASMARNQESYSNTLKENNIPQVQVSLIQSFDNNNPTIDYKQKYYSTLKQLTSRQSKILEKSKSQKQKIRLTETNSYQRNTTKTSSQNDDVVVTSYIARDNNFNKVLKCHYHPIKQAKYLVELNDDEDLLCCKDCGNLLDKQGFQLEQISSLKSKRTYDIDDFLQKSLKSINNLKKYMQQLPDHYRSVYNQLKVQIQNHDNYYDSLIELINKKKQESKLILTKSMNKISQYFDNAHRILEQQYLQIQANYKHMIVNREDMKQMSQNNFYQILNEYVNRLEIDEVNVKTKLLLWKVEVGDIKEFQKQFQKFVVRIDQDDTKTKSILEESTCQLFCEEEFDTGYHRSKQKDQPINQNKDMYFSFQKKNKLDLENYDSQYANSPAFKQI